MPLELFLLIKILCGSGMSFFSFLILSCGPEASHEGSVCGSSNLLINELLAPFSRSLLTRYGSRSLYLPIGA
jgi:hypothetical protein